jgi:hypothetical protein
VTIATTPFADMARNVIKDQGVSDMCLVVVEHPIAGHNTDGIRKKMDGVYPEIIQAATKWRPGK